MKPIFAAFLITLFGISRGVFAYHEGGDERVIRKTSPPSAERVIETGLNGVLQWKEDKEGLEYMVLVGPSGLDYEIGKISSSMREALEPLAAKKVHIEVFGSLKIGNGKRIFRVNEIESKKSNEKGEFIIGLKKGISDQEKKDLADLLEQIPTTKVINASVDFLVVKSDLSRKSFFKYFGNKAR